MNKKICLIAAMILLFWSLGVSAQWGLAWDKVAQADNYMVASGHALATDSPHYYYPGKIQLEHGIRDRASALGKMNFKVEILPRGTVTSGAVCAIIRDKSGHLIGGADPREEAIVKGE